MREEDRRIFEILDEIRGKSEEIYKTIGKTETTVGIIEERTRSQEKDIDRNEGDIKELSKEFKVLQGNFNKFIIMNLLFLLGLIGAWIKIGTG